MIRIAAATALAVLTATPLFAEDAPRRRMDQWSGIVFFCTPNFEQTWTIAACTAITEAFVEETEAAGIKVAVLDMSSEPQWMAKSAEAGFDGGYALDVGFELEASVKPKGFTALSLNGQFPTHPKPGVKPEAFASFAAQSVVLGEGDQTEAAGEVARTVWSGILDYLNAPP